MHYRLCKISCTPKIALYSLQTIFYKAICFLNYLIKANFTLVEIDSLSDIQADKHMYATIDNLLADAYYAQI